MPNNKPQEALQLGLNVLIDKSCEGEHCRFHEFPYEINNILLRQKEKQIKFNNINDVWDYIKLLQRESIKHQKKGSSFSILNDIWEQLPFFVCSNKLIDENAQNSISRYVYSKDTNTPPYPGSYGDTPHIWVQKYYIIKQAIALREQKLQQKAKNGSK